MNVKKSLKELQKFIPTQWLESLQHIHSSLIFEWILHNGSQPLVLSQKSAMIFSPHQDDETFGCGGIIALKREQNIPVVVVFITDGQGGGVVDADSSMTIVEIRKQEALTALEILGVEPSEIYFLEKPDGTLPYLASQDRQQTVEQIVALLEKYQPEEVYVPHRKDCHRDHEATYTLVKEAVEKVGNQVDFLQYPIWLLWRAPLFVLIRLQDIKAACHLSISSVQEKKNRAIESYSSQLESLPNNFTKRFLGTNEIFFKS
jgi:N-acetylglucosamine malate deacetylase 1